MNHRAPSSAALWAAMGTIQVIGILTGAINKATAMTTATVADMRVTMPTTTGIITAEKVRSTTVATVFRPNTATASMS